MPKPSTLAAGGGPSDVITSMEATPRSGYVQHQKHSALERNVRGGELHLVCARQWNETPQLNAADWVKEGRAKVPVKLTKEESFC
eukprot:m.94584 g.94584  ORF g.94584 m.94584 type:complete len:85 (+) comp36823_c0_seq6:252-506(+)